LKNEGLAPGNGAIEWIYIDLLDPRKAKACAEELMKRENRLDILSKRVKYGSGRWLILALVNNASMSVIFKVVFENIDLTVRRGIQTYTITPDGVRESMMTR
jgi:hypothetical protein